MGPPPVSMSVVKAFRGAGAVAAHQHAVPAFDRAAGHRGSRRRHQSASTSATAALLRWAALRARTWVMQASNTRKGDPGSGVPRAGVGRGGRRARAGGPTTQVDGAAVQTVFRRRAYAYCRDFARDATAEQPRHAAESGAVGGADAAESIARQPGILAACLFACGGCQAGCDGFPRRRRGEHRVRCRWRLGVSVGAVVPVPGGAAVAAQRALGAHVASRHRQRSCLFDHADARHVQADARAVRPVFGDRRLVALVPPAWRRPISCRTTAGERTMFSAQRRSCVARAQ